MHVLETINLNLIALVCVAHSCRVIVAGLYQVFIFCKQRIEPVLEILFFLKKLQACF